MQFGKLTVLRSFAKRINKIKLGTGCVRRVHELAPLDRTNKVDYCSLLQIICTAARSRQLLAHAKASVRPTAVCRR